MRDRSDGTRIAICRIMQQEVPRKPPEPEIPPPKDPHIDLPQNPDIPFPEMTTARALFDG